MRLLRLDLDQGSTGVDLHPFLTVVQGLDDAQRAAFITAVRSVARGSALGVVGLVQHRGQLVELDGTADALVGAAGTGADIVIDADAGEMADLLPLQARIDQLRRRSEIDAIRVEEVRADLDPRARFEVAVLQARLDPVSEDELARRRDLADRLERAIAALAGIEPHIRQAPDGVVALRQRWERYLERVEEAADHLRSLERAVVEAEAHVAEARTIVARAEQDAQPILLSRDEETRLELLSFPAMDRSRRGRWRKTLRPEEQAEMEALLAKVGVESWTAYTVYRSSPVVAADRLAVLTQAEEAEAQALAALDEAQRRQKRDPLLLELNQELLDVRGAARRHLGMMLPPDLGRALGGLVEERPNPAWVAALHQLRQVLLEIEAGTGIGRAVGPGTDTTTAPAPELVARAQEWLVSHREVAAAPDTEAIRARLARAQGRLDRHQRALARIARDEAAAAASARELEALEAEAARRVAGEPPGVATITSQVDLVAAQIAVDGGGPVPVVLTGALTWLDDAAVDRLLEHLARLATGVQVVVVSEAPAVAAWAGDAGLGRALVSGPRPAVGTGGATVAPAGPDGASTS